jgi:UDP-N-acetylmuramyl pentapeptide synthase
MDLHRKKLAVLDLTHGGIPIAKKLAASGSEVYAVDVYKTVKPDFLEELGEKYGINCSTTPLPTPEFDFLIAPVHLDSAYPMLAEARAEGKRVFTHHEIVGEILKEDSRLAGTKTIEVTGVKAKTSTASLLADMLSREFKVVLHTSRGLEYWTEGAAFPISRGLSITPGSMLVAVDRAFEAGFIPDFFIFEISIGGTGNADIGILTTLAPDYGIANNTALASEAKLQLIRNAKPESILLLNAAAEKALRIVKKGHVKVLTFKDPFIVDIPGNQASEIDFEVKIVNKSESQAEYSELSFQSNLPGFSTSQISDASSDSTLHFIQTGNELFSASLLPGYNISAYRTAFVAASAAALELGIEKKHVIAVLEEFRGLLGRMQEKEMNGFVLIDNSNSGMDILSAEKALEYALLRKKDEKKEGVILILGEEASQVCEGLPPELVESFMDKFGAKCRKVILVGERMRTILAKDVTYADNLPEGLVRAFELAREDDIILSSVKCFR